MNATPLDRLYAAVSFLGAVVLLAAGLYPGASRAVMTVRDLLGVSVPLAAAQALAVLFMLWVAAEVVAVRLVGFDALRRGSSPATFSRYAGLCLVPLLVLFHPSLSPLGRWIAIAVPGAGERISLVGWAILGLCVVGFGTVAVRAVRAAVRGYRSDGRETTA